uniref:Uncharacterized protein n=1 Tax=viral metagenome TaxID=1070528 RepID=A0A6C0IQZ3_9ZZZZ
MKENNFGNKHINSFYSKVDFPKSKLMYTPHL